MYVDRVYTSVTLCEYLIQNRGTKLCETAMPNRKRFPNSLIRTPKEREKGDSEILFNGYLTAIVEMDKKPIYFVTSTQINAPLDNVQRYDVKEHRRIPTACPKALKSYNAYMGRTDQNDQMTRLHKFSAPL